ncbi:uncharacterized protein TrAtP1_007793 [Trichoderma atroviride]|uniref:uncharacterized protein n=1 Tax=Hypocrea atroviridis TaxID=63577 RepID=UPI003318A8F3|nr:hypothetical protein TrAtP1_007793 [Trichoderma atroviride]
MTRATGLCNEVPGRGSQIGQCSSTWRTGDRQEHNVDGSAMDYGCMEERVGEVEGASTGWAAVMPW